MSKVLVVGDRPKSDDPNDTPFLNARCKEKLQRWLDSMGITDYVLSNQVREDLPETVTNFPKAIALGEKAAKRLKKLGVQHYRLPHPSGANRLLNDKRYEEFVIADCARWVRGEITEPTPFHSEVDIRAKGNTWK